MQHVTVFLCFSVRNHTGKVASHKQNQIDDLLVHEIVETDAYPCTVEYRISDVFHERAQLFCEIIAYDGSVRRRHGISR